MDTAEVLPQCSIGQANNSECHLKSFNPAPSKLKLVIHFNLKDQELIQRRSGISTDDKSQICLHHEATILTKYEFLQKTCCNPFQKKGHSIRKGLRPITVSTADKLKELTKMDVKPGQKLCPNCQTDLSRKSELHLTTVSDNDEDKDFCDDLNEDSDVEKTDSSLTSLGLSPLKFRRVSSQNRRSYAKRKIRQVQETVTDQIATAGGLNPDEFRNPGPSKECQNCDDYNQLLKELKEKIALPGTPKSVKLQILTLAPNSWSIQRTSKEFNVSERMVRDARQLKAKSGILATPVKKRGRPISEAVKQKVVNFFQDDEYSRLCPGKKDFISIKDANGKEKVQKRLLLNNLKEMFVAYRNQHGPEIGFSKFCELRPKWCVNVGAAGMHSVCVCTTHQNVKLILNASPVEIDYKVLLSKIVCSLDSKDCMLQRCDNCPGTEELHKFLMEIFNEFDLDDDIIEFKQWVHTDRDTLDTKHLLLGEFIDDLVAKILKLSSHHYIAKHQSRHLKNVKENLKPGELVVLMDFAENYSFIIQDAVQGYHWDNSQATLHTFAVYYKIKDEVQCISFCTTSDCLRHDTIAVHVFLVKLINHLKSLMEEIVHIHYFSDDSAAQYKNYKNFINLCCHKNEFGISAEWNFFGTSHGTSPYDGIGETIKRLAGRASLQRTVENKILTTKDLFNFCDQQIQGIKFFFVSNEEVEAERIVQEERFENGHTVAGTRENHHFLPIDSRRIQVSRVSNDTTSFVTAVDQSEAGPITPIQSLFPGQYIACIYDNQWYIGNICQVSIEENDAEVKFMSPLGPARSFFWPEREEICWVSAQQIIMHIPAPTTRTGRQYNLPEALLQSIQEKFNSMKQ